MMEKQITVKDIYTSLTKRSQDFEKLKGIVEISSVVDARLRPSESLSFIDSYRKIIRNNTWHHDENPNTNYNDLMKRWAQSSQQYQQNGMRFFEYIQSNLAEELPEFHQIAMISETARKRDGKGSRIGLDAFLDSYIGRLDRLIRICYNEENSEDVAGLLASTIGAPHISAENELYFDFADYAQQVGKPISREVYESLGDSGRTIADKILREYSKYSMKDFNDKLSRINPNEDGVNKKKNALNRIENERRVVISRTNHLISKKGSGEDSTEFLTLVERINELNYLNTNVEAKFSFKGAPGLFHHFVFEDARKMYEDIEDIYHRNFVLSNSEGDRLL